MTTVDCPRKHNAQAGFFALLAVVLCSLATPNSLCHALAQEQPPAVEDPPKDKDVEMLPPPTDWERLIYLPYKNLKQVFEKEGAAVFMPYAQFLRMWDKTHVGNMRDPAKPPVNAVITSAAYTGRITGDVAQIEAALTVQVLGRPWVELPIQFGDAAIGKVSSSDEKVLLQATGNGTYALLFSQGRRAQSAAGIVGEGPHLARRAQRRSRLSRVGNHVRRFDGARRGSGDRVDSPGGRHSAGGGR